MIKILLKQILDSVRGQTNTSGSGGRGAPLVRECVGGRVNDLPFPLTSAGALGSPQPLRRLPEHGRLENLAAQAPSLPPCAPGLRIVLRQAPRLQLPFILTVTSRPRSGVRENAGDFAPRDGNPDPPPDPECGALLGNPIMFTARQSRTGNHRSKSPKG